MTFPGFVQGNCLKSQCPNSEILCLQLQIFMSLLNFISISEQNCEYSVTLQMCVGVQKHTLCL